MLLDGKSVFLTGATGGIGMPLVNLLIERGANVVAYDRTTQGNLMESIDTTCKALREHTPDILINLAGINDFNHAEDQDYDALVTLNLLVPMRLCQAVLPAMRKRGSGQIVNIGSMTGLIPLPHMTGYVAAKSGLKGYSDALRRELTGTGITITNVTEDDPRDVARQIVNAIEHDKTDVRIGWPERLFALINAVIPGIVDRGLRKNTAIGEEILKADQVVAPIPLIANKPDANPRSHPA